MRCTLRIEALAPGGEGLGRAGGHPVFVPFTAPGDRVEAEVPDRGGAGRAALVRVISPGPSRVPAPCRHFGPPPDPAAAGAAERLCGGCEWLHLDYREQLASKERSLAETLRRIGRLEPGAYRLEPALPSPRALRYRSRAKLHLDRASGRLAFFRRRSREAVPLLECHLLEEGLDRLREAAGPALVAARIPAAEVTLEWSAYLGSGAACLRLAEHAAAARSRAEALLAALPDLRGVVLAAEGAPPRLVGDPVLLHARDPEDPSRGLARSRPDVFQQANRGANAAMVRAALDLLAPEGEDVLELFSGAGNLTGPLSARARSVAAVEAQGPALELARQDLAEPAGAAGGAAAPAGVRFYAGEALGVARALGREGRRFGRVLLDPPREGARGVGPLLRELGVPRAVYVSCDPATLARDLRGCAEAGYRVEAVRPVDMFPQTHHVEAVALLVRAP